MRYVCTPMFTEALFTTVNIFFKKPTCPLRDERIKTTWCICVCGVILVSHEKAGNAASCDNMDGT